MKMVQLAQANRLIFSVHCRFLRTTVGLGFRRRDGLVRFPQTMHKDQNLQATRGMHVDRFARLYGWGHELANAFGTSNMQIDVVTL